MNIKSLIFVTIAITACTANVHRAKSPRILRIIKTDYINDYYVFNVKDEEGNAAIILAEKDKFVSCKTLGNSIISDSVHETSTIRNGKKYDFIGFNVSIINGIKIRDDKSLVKVIEGCGCFVNR